MFTFLIFFLNLGMNASYLVKTQQHCSIIRVKHTYDYLTISPYSKNYVQLFFFEKLYDSTLS